MYANRIDLSQNEIIDVLAKNGCWVHRWSTGGGPVDLIVWDGASLFFIECKIQVKPSSRRLTKRCYDFASKCPAPGAICIDAHDALAALTASRKHKLPPMSFMCEQYFLATGRKFS